MHINHTIRRKYIEQRRNVEPIDWHKLMYIHACMLHAHLRIFMQSIYWLIHLIQGAGEYILPCEAHPYPWMQLAEYMWYIKQLKAYHPHTILNSNNTSPQLSGFSKLIIALRRKPETLSQKIKLTSHHPKTRISVLRKKQEAICWIWPFFPP